MSEAGGSHGGDAAHSLSLNEARRWLTVWAERQIVGKAGGGWLI